MALVSGRYAVYSFACGCRRHWSDGVAVAPTKAVQLDRECDNCLRAATAKRRELRLLYGRAVTQMGDDGRRKGAR